LARTKKRLKPGPRVTGSPAKPVAFRIPGNVLDRLDIVARNKFLSRNKLVTMILDENLPKRPETRKDIDNEQPSLFD
jgi:hypothetical protein